MAVLAALGVRYFGWSATAWTELSGWSSYPVLAGLAVVGLSTMLATALSLFLGAAKMFLSRGSKGSRSRPVNRSSRPQSQRKTTV